MINTHFHNAHLKRLSFACLRAALSPLVPVLCALGLIVVAPALCYLGASARAEMGRIAPKARKIKLVVLPFALDVEAVGTQIGAPSASEQARLERARRTVERELRRSGRYAIIPLAGYRDLLAKASAGQPFNLCHGCELDVGRVLGADWVLVGWVHKTSNLILAEGIRVEDVRSGALIKEESVQIRGNSDRSWNLGFDYMLKEAGLIS